MTGKELNGVIESYKPEYLLDLLFKAIRLTVPNFDIDEIENKLLCFEEVKIINHISIVYSEQGERRKAIEIYRQLFKYMNKHYVDLAESAAIIILVAYNYSKQLGLEGRYEEGIEVAEIGRKKCVEFRNSNCHGKILGNLAYAYYELEKYEESKKLLYQAYYIFKAMKDDLCASITEKNAWDWFKIKFPY